MDNTINLLQKSRMDQTPTQKRSSTASSMQALQNQNKPDTPNMQSKLYVDVKSGPEGVKYNKGNRASAAKDLHRALYPNENNEDPNKHRDEDVLLLEQALALDDVVQVETVRRHPQDEIPEAVHNRRRM